ncbi:alpha-L-fucosidase [Sphingobacterium yanglingense]|uniref:alpha-L-fucosidase n=1 Tax=Sphingobacterium yanglingense TaxID=1437280 RepID=A0A4R6WLR2_9SPHI|nr:alpha-L-fucosidase [Sphingobacterium yanglingense]TDQ81764.1 alpha-L-fucosidase [Sphingobacterium yanglingense]
MIKRLFIGLVLFSLFAKSYGQNNLPKEEKMLWFDDAKLGIFIHWGVYAVNGVSESWSFFNNYMSHDNYLKQLDGFTAKEYKPQEWVSLIKESGAQYTVITTKHHDGIALWDSKADKALTVPKHAIAKQDVLTPFIAAVKKAGLKTGLYYSLPDWSHPYYDIVTRSRKRYTLKDEPKRWGQFVDYYQGQLAELSSQYKPDLLWFDGDWEHSAQEWRAEQTLGLLRKYNPNIIVNSRLNHHGDYATPEQGVPVKRPADRYWELCYTMNDSWGYQHFDTNYKTPNMIVRTLIDCIAMGGNLLLDIGPKADGTIPDEQVKILKELGRWTSKYKEAIYGTRAGVASAFIAEKNSLSKDGKTVYIYLDEVKNYLQINGLQSKPVQVRFISSSDKIDYKYNGYTLSLNMTTQDFDPTASVIAIDFADHPHFEFDHAEVKPVLNDVLRAKDAPSAIRDIVEFTSAGANLFSGHMSDDGSVLSKDLKFADQKIKNWVLKHAEVLHDARTGISDGHYIGNTALSQDRQTLYLFIEGQPTGPVAIKGLNNTIARIRIVGEGSMIGHKIYNKLYWSAIPGIVYIDVPKDRLDSYCTVVAVLLDKPIELYAEEVKAIESNL